MVINSTGLDLYSIRNISVNLGADQLPEVASSERGKPIRFGAHRPQFLVGRTVLRHISANAASLDQARSTSSQQIAIGHMANQA